MARIGFSTSRHLPTVRVQPRSQFLHAVGPEAAVKAVHELLDAELGRLRFWVNRVDLFADWQGWTSRHSRTPNASSAGPTPAAPTRSPAP